MSAIDSGGLLVGDSEYPRIEGVAVGGGAPPDTASYLVFESDGTSQLLLESGAGSLLLETSS